MFQNIFQNILIFKNLSEEEITALSQLATSHLLKKAEILALDLLCDSSLIIVKHGSVDVKSINDDGKDILLVNLREQDVFGECSLVDNYPQSEKIEAVEDSELIMLKCNDVTKLLRTSTAFADALLQNITLRYRGRLNNGFDKTFSRIIEKIDDCWNHIGIFSKEKATCEKLENVIHCHNCDKFVQEGRGLLMSKPPADYLEEWTDLIAKEKDIESSATLSVLIFRLGEEWFALHISVVYEIVELLVVRSIPFENRELLLGMVNIRGEIQLCISMSHLLGLECLGNGGNDDKHKAANRVIFERMIFVGENDSKWVFPVDEVYGIQKINHNNLFEAPATTSKAASNYTKGLFNWENRNVDYLDEDLLFYSLNRSLF